MINRKGFNIQMNKSIGLKFDIFSKMTNFSNTVFE